MAHGNVGESEEEREKKLWKASISMWLRLICLLIFYTVFN